MGKKKTKAAPPDSTAAPDSAAALVTLETLTAGDGTTVPKLGDACTVHYEGTLLSDGTMFDSSRVKKVPFTFKLGGGGVIKGYDRGVSQMSVGQRAKLTIPSHAAYGSVGAVDKQNASGTGIIPPDADLNFDVELLDVNFALTLGRYQATLEAWIASKLAAYDDDAEVRAPLEAKHSNRDGYSAHLHGAAARKYDAERAKRAASVGVDLARLPTADAAPRPPAPGPPLLHAAAERAAEPAAVAAAVDAAAAAVSSTTLADAPAPAPEPPAPEPPAEEPSAVIQFDARFATFKIDHNDESERRAANFPRSLHNAAELFIHLGHSECAARLHQCVMRHLQTLAAGPDGRSAQRLGRACICWSCGHVGLPRNSASCSDKGPKPAGVCDGCGDDSQTNFVRCVQEGQSLPWIEAPPPLTPEQAAKADEAKQAAIQAEAAEVAVT